jgi:AAHS family 4-hydroxybenzoate transporter-like MFS transporter
MVPILCCLVMLTEGMDTYGVGYVGSFIAKEYGIAPSMLGAIYTATVVASLLGAIGVAPVSDRIGRRPVLMLSSLLMGLCTLLTPFASSGPLFFLVRFLIGLGFGAALPTAFALTGDYAPARHRSIVIMMMSSGIALGMVLAGLLAAAVIPLFGWHALLYLNGGLSLICTLALAVKLPESLRFLAQRRPGSPVLARLVERLATERGEPAPTLLEPMLAKKVESGQVRLLFVDGRAAMTLLLWFAMSAAYCVEFFMSYWLPTILMEDNTKVASAGLVLAIGKVGSILGAIAVGLTMDRRGPTFVLAAGFFITALSICLLGQSAGTLLVAVPMVVMTCFFMDGSFSGIQAFTTASYPGAIRATGTGWVTGFSRLIGGSAGTMSGGLLIEAHWSIPQIAMLLSVPMFCACLAMLWLHRRSRRASIDSAVLVANGVR